MNRGAVHFIPWTDADDAAVLRLYEAGHSHAQIAMRCGRSEDSTRNRILKLRRSQGLEPRTSPPVYPATKADGSRAWSPEELVLLGANKHLKMGELRMLFPHRSKGSIDKKVRSLFGLRTPYERAPEMAETRPPNKPFDTLSGIRAIRREGEAVPMPYIPTIHSHLHA
jgi:hypothetical protein